VQAPAESALSEGFGGAGVALAEESPGFTGKTFGPPAACGPCGGRRGAGGGRWLRWPGRCRPAQQGGDRKPRRFDIARHAADPTVDVGAHAGLPRGEECRTLRQRSQCGKSASRWRSRSSCGPATEAIAGEVTILNRRSLDNHITSSARSRSKPPWLPGHHPAGGGTRPPPAAATTCHPRRLPMGACWQAARRSAGEPGLLRQGPTPAPDPSKSKIRAGACIPQTPEDWGTTPPQSTCLFKQWPKFDIQVCIPLAPSTKRALLKTQSGQSAVVSHPHPFNTEGAGGGHAPTSIAVCARPTCWPAPQPTRPYSPQHARRTLDMLMVCHHWNPSIPEDVAFAESRIRRETHRR